MMMGCEERPFSEGGKLIPLHKHGVKLMSLGSILEEGQAVLWRGPMVAGTVKQLLTDVHWGELDYLLVDLPPGTGDAPMSLAQLAPLTGVVIVTTPHHVAANIAGKSVQLFSRLNAPILGVVENMAGFVCPKCGELTRIFAGLTGRELAGRFDVPFLGSIPLDPAVSGASDAGVPSILAAPDSLQASAFREIAGALAAQISIRAMAEPVAR
jgi:ATP-binding protein involved in chromosome partitioning